MKQAKKTLTLQEIAILARTTKSTVSRVLSNDSRISDKTKARVEAVVRKHSFRPNQLAQALARGRTGTMGVLTSNISSGFFAEVIRGIDIAAGRSKGHLHVSIAHGIEDYFRLFADLSVSGQVDGIVLIDPPLDLFGQVLADDHIPLVLCASRAQEQAHTWRNVDSVTVDNSHVMARIVEHLVEQGCRDIVHLAGPPDIYDAQQRRTAFEQTAQRLNVPQMRILDRLLIQSDGRDIMMREFRDPSRLPDAFVAFNDSVAFGVMEQLPKDLLGSGRIALTGWDNSPSSVVLGLTSTEMPLTSLGEMSARMLLDRVEGHIKADEPARHIDLDMELHVRNSSRLMSSAERIN